MTSPMGFHSMSEEYRLRFQLELKADVNLKALIKERVPDDPIRKMAEDILAKRPKA